MAKKKPVEEKPVEKVSIDQEIGKGLSPKKEQSELDQAAKDFALHPKFAKFNSQGSEQP